MINYERKQMKRKLLLATVLMALSTQAWATPLQPNALVDINVNPSVKVETDLNVGIGVKAGAEATAGALSGSQSSVGNVTNTSGGGSAVGGSVTIENPSDLKIRNVPSMGAPSLTSSNDTCMGSTSGAISMVGGGISLGDTDPEENCVMLKNARELYNMGMKAAAIALLCTNDNNRYALEVTGASCPAKREENSWISQMFGAPKYKESK